MVTIDLRRLAEVSLSKQLKVICAVNSEAFGLRRIDIDTETFSTPLSTLLTRHG
jgi:hypothetical protein